MNDAMPAAAAAPVRVRRLRLADFRNHVSLDLAFATAGVAFAGANGTGKTNVLEALSQLAPGRGFRRATLAEMARAGGSGGFSVAVDLDGPFGPVRIGVGAQPGEATRSIRIDGEAQKGADVLADYLRPIWLVPAMDGLFTGGAGDRRRFLDRMVLTVDPAHGRRVAAYEAAVTARNRLLADPRADTIWLDGLEAQIAEIGVAVAAARGDAVARLSRLIAARGDAGAFPLARLALDGGVDAALAEATATDVESWLAADLRAGRSRDRAAGRTLSGPHRSDLGVTHAGKEMPAALCSTGEQKALLVGLVLAQAAMVAATSGLEPILLLDEVGAHLDAGRRQELFGLIAGLGAQAFFTGTDGAAFATGRLDLAVIDLAAGPAGPG